jgi:lysophospholipase L1-like esterase
MRATALLVILCSLAGGCASASTAPARRGWSLVALGDSVPYGTHCDCRPFPALSARELSVRTHRRVTATNDAVPGYTSSDVLHQLRSDEDVIDDVRAADAVEIEIGANDVAFQSSCGTNVGCYAHGVTTVERNLPAIVARVRELTAGRRVLVVLLDYWNVWLGGKYAAAKGAQYVAAAEELTDRIDTEIRVVAGRTRSVYVDLRAAFKGPSYDYDETHYLSSDGDHPNASGHRRIAAAADAAVLRTMARRSLAGR